MQRWVDRGLATWTGPDEITTKRNTPPLPGETEAKGGPAIFRIVHEK